MPACHTLLAKVTSQARNTVVVENLGILWERLDGDAVMRVPAWGRIALRFFPPVQLLQQTALTGFQHVLKFQALCEPTTFLLISQV